MSRPRNKRKLNVPGMGTARKVAALESLHKPKARTRKCPQAPSQRDKG